MLWEVDILPKDDPLASDVADEAAELGIGDGIEVRAARGYLLEGQLAKKTPCGSGSSCWPIPWSNACGSGRR